MDVHAVPAAWYEDPSDSTLIRYWDGSAWTEQIAPHQSAEAVDDIAPVQPKPPQPRSESRAPAQAQPQPYGSPPAPTHTSQPPASVPPQPHGSPPAASYGAAPTSSYGSPPVASYGAAPTSSYGSPPASSYGSPPTASDGAAPASPYGAPPPPQYGAPPPPPHGAPFAPNYGAPYGPGYKRSSSRAGRTLLIGLAYVAAVVVVLFVIGFVVLIKNGGVEATGRGAGSTGCGPGDTGTAAPLPEELRANVTAGRPVITPQAARGLVEAVWPVREQALYSCDLATLKEIDTGAARIGDLERAQCGCLIRSENAPILDAKYYVPRQTAFPAYFTAEVQTEEVRGTSWGEIMVFTRASRKAHWQLTLATGSGADPGDTIGLGEPELDAGGYVRMPNSRTKKAAAGAATRLAAFWQKSKDTGHVPSNPFSPSDWTTSLPADIAEYPQDTLQRNGLPGHSTYRMLPGEPIYHVLNRGTDMACTVLRVVLTYTGTADGAYPQQPRDRTNWGPTLAPGVYRSITVRGVSQTCIYVPIDGQGKAWVIGGDYRHESVATGVLLKK